MTPTSEVIRLAREAGIRFGEFDVPFEDRKVTRTMGAQPIENIARLISLAKAEALAEGWQPIETVPKDAAILFGPTKRMGICVGMHHSRDGWVTETPSEWVPIYPPTHWRPLPPPPKEAP